MNAEIRRFGVRLIRISLWFVRGLCMFMLQREVEHDGVVV